MFITGSVGFIRESRGVFKTLISQYYTNIAA